MKKKKSKRSDLAVQIETQQRRARVLQLRLQGCTYREIARQIKTEFGEQAPNSYSERHAWDDLHRALEHQRQELTESTEETRQLELERLDNLYRKLDTRYDERGELKIVELQLKIIELRTRLIGAFTPDQQMVTAPFIVNVIRDVRDKSKNQ